MSYAEDAQTALELIRDFGFTTTWRRTTPGTLTPATDTDGTPTEVTASVTIVALPARAPRDLAPGAGSVILTDQRKVLLAAVGFAYDLQPVTDALYFDNAWWKVLASTVLRPDGATAILHTAIVERGAA